MDSFWGYCYRPPTLAESISEAGEILPVGTVDFAHRHRPYARDGLRYRGRMRGDVGREQLGARQP
jgi:hypothetical protein